MNSASLPNARRRGPAPPPAAEERDALMVAATTLIAREGSAAVTVADVLSEAGLGTRAFYRHFDSKGELLLAIWEQEADRTVQRIRLVMHDTPNGLAAVEAWVKYRVDRVFDHRRGAAYELLWPEGSWLGNAYPHEFHALVVRPTIELLRGAIKTGVLDGSIAPMPSPVLDASTIHATFWMLAERHFDGRRITRAEAQRHMDRVVRALLVPKS